MKRNMLRTMHSIKYNFIMNFILSASQFIFPLITYPYISRVLMPEGLGKVTFATSLLTYFSMFAQMGIPTYGVRVCAQVRDDRKALTRTVHELFIINLVMTGAAYLVFAFTLLTVPRLQEDRALYIIMSAMILLNTIGVEWLYRALEEYTFITIRSLVFKIIAVVSMFLLVRLPEDYLIYAALTLVASHISYTLNFVRATRIISIRPAGGYCFSRHYKPILVFFAMACATTIYTNLDTVMLGFMKTDADVGYYNTAIKIKNVLVSFVASLGTVLLPRVSYYAENRLMEEFWSVCRKALNFVLILATPLVMYFIIFAEPSILLLSGNEFLPSVQPMQIIMPTVLFIGITNILGIQIMIPLNHEKMVLFSVAIGALVDIIINAVFIPSYASSGAAIGTLVAEFIVLLVQYWVLRRELSSTVRSISYLKILLGLFIGTFASAWVRTMPWNSFLSLAVSALLFFGAYGSTLLLSKERLTMEIFNSMKQKFIRKA